MLAIAGGIILAVIVLLNWRAFLSLAIGIGAFVLLLILIAL